MKNVLKNKRLSTIRIAFLMAVTLMGGLLLSACGPNQEARTAAEVLISDADELVSQHRYADALQKYAEARDTDEGNVDIYTGISEIYRMKNRESDAREILDEGIEKSREPSQAYMLRGKIALDDGDPEEAITYLRNAVSKDGRNYEAAYLLADAYVDNDSFDDARSELKLPEDGGDWYVRAQLLKALLIANDLESSQEEIEKLEDVDIQDDELSDQVDTFVEVLNTIDTLDEDQATSEYIDVLISYAALAAGHENLVIDRLSDYVSDESEYWEVYLYLGRAYYMDGDMDRAEEYLREAAVINTADPLAPWQLARVYVDQGQDTEVETYYKRALALSDDDQKTDVRVEYIGVLLDSGQYTAADEQFAILIDEDSENAEEYKLLKIRSLIDREVYDVAKDSLEDVDASGLSDELLAQYSWAKSAVLFGTGDREEALDWIEDAIDIDNVDAKFYLLEGQIHFELGDEDTAKISLERAVDLDLEGDVSAEAAKILDRL